MAPWIAVWLMVCAFGVMFAWLSVSRHVAFQSHAFDLGNVDQAVWNTVHGRWLRFTDMTVGQTVLTSRLAIHVEPILIPLSLLYAFRPGPLTLLVVQPLVVSLGAVPLYLLARQELRRPWLALVFPFGYLAHPSLQNAVLDDFHAVAFSACFLAWAIYFVRTDRVGLFALAVVLAASTKEEVGLLAACLGLWLWIRGHRVPAIAVIVCGVSWFLLCIGVIVPHFNPQGQSPYLARYGYLGHGISGVARSVIVRPGTVVRALFAPERRPYLLYLVHPLGNVALLGAPILLLTLPVVVINLLSADPTMYSGYYQYSVELIPFVVAASIMGTAWMGRYAEKLHAGGRAYVLPVLCVLVLAGSLYDDWRWGYTPLSQGYVIPSVGVHQKVENSILGQIPPTATVAAADEIEPHLSDRRWIYLLPTTHPENGPAAEYIVLDASVPSSPVGPGALHQVATHALSHGYGFVAADDGILLLRKGAPRTTLPPRFFTFAFTSSLHMVPCSVSWGALHLVGFVLHPQSRSVNRARPAIGVETFWRRTGAVEPHGTASVLVTSASSNGHVFGTVGQSSRDSPTFDWLPPPTWPLHRLVHAAFVPIPLDTTRPERVNVAIKVDGMGAPTSASASAKVTTDGLVVIGSVDVEP
jgi:uncharacterized membrane protein